MRPSGQSTGQCTTDTQGLCTIDIAKDTDHNPLFAPATRPIKSGTELTYLSFNEVKLQLGLYDTDGASSAKSEVRIAAHSERGAYRPGDDAHLFAVLRNKNNRAPKAGLPVKLTIVDGRGQNSAV